MATLIKPDGTETNIVLEKSTSLKTLQDAVGGFIELLHTKDGRYMLVNENGKNMQLPANKKATDMWHGNTPSVVEIILGNVVVCDKKEVESEDDEDEA